MMYVRYPLSLRNVEDLLAERGIDISPLSLTSFAQAEHGVFTGLVNNAGTISRALDSEV